MPLYCDDGAPAEITPWVPVPPLAKGETRPRILESERDRCQRAECRKLAIDHRTTRPGVRWEVTDRGPRIVIPIGGEEIVMSTDSARRIRDELTTALRAVEADKP